jgi:subtilisin family serine protease
VDDHATHVSGIISAKDNNLGVVGVAPGAEIWSLDVFAGGASAPFTTIANAITFVRNNAARIKVCNISLGGFALVSYGFENPFNANPDSHFINALVNDCANAGVIMVVAAGSTSYNLDSRPVVINNTPNNPPGPLDFTQVFVPATASQAVCVTALVDTDGRFGGLGPSSFFGPDDGFADFSNFGTTVEVIAPGVDILSTITGNQYGSISGTSMSAPHIAGLMALYSNSYITASGTNPPQQFQIQFGARRRPTGRELCALFCRVRGVELIPGLFDFRDYPLLVNPSKVR